MVLWKPAHVTDRLLVKVLGRGAAAEQVLWTIKSMREAQAAGGRSMQKCCCRHGGVDLLLWWGCP